MHSCCSQSSFWIDNNETEWVPRWEQRSRHAKIGLQSGVRASETQCCALCCIICLLLDFNYKVQTGKQAAIEEDIVITYINIINIIIRALYIAIDDDYYCLSNFVYVRALTSIFEDDAEEATAAPTKRTKCILYIYRYIRVCTTTIWIILKINCNNSHVHETEIAHPLLLLFYYHCYDYIKLWWLWYFSIDAFLVFIDLYCYYYYRGWGYDSDSGTGCDVSIENNGMFEQSVTTWRT